MRDIREVRLKNDLQRFCKPWTGNLPKVAAMPAKKDVSWMNLGYMTWFLLYTEARLTSRSVPTFLSWGPVPRRLLVGLDGQAVHDSLQTWPPETNVENRPGVAVVESADDQGLAYA